MLSGRSPTRGVHLPAASDEVATLLDDGHGLGLRGRRRKPETAASNFPIALASANTLRSSSDEATAVSKGNAIRIDTLHGATASAPVTEAISRPCEFDESG